MAVELSGQWRVDCSLSVQSAESEVLHCSSLYSTVQYSTPTPELITPPTRWAWTRPGQTRATSGGHHRTVDHSAQH